MTKRGLRINYQEKTVESNYFFLNSTVLSTNFLQDGTVPSTNFLRDGTVASQSFSIQNIPFSTNKNKIWAKTLFI